MRYVGCISLIVGLVFCFSCESDHIYFTDLDAELDKAIKQTSPTGNSDFYVLAESSDLANIPQDPNNPLTKEKVDLGRFLFFETGLAMEAEKTSGIGTYSCGSCHIPSAGFKPGRSQGVADGGVGFGVNGEMRLRNTEYLESEMDVQALRPLSVLNVAYSAENTLWNGSFGSGGANEGTEDIWGVFDELTEINHLGYQGLETQNIEGLKIHRLVINEDLMAELGYKEMFDNVFSEFPVDERYTRLTGSLAISAYLRSLTTTEAPFQKWLKGDRNAMTKTEKRGAVIFFTKANCTACHSGEAFSATEFHAIGVNDLFERASFNENPDAKKNFGRGGFTGNPDDNYKFKVPTLYNLTQTPFYFHGSSKENLHDVVEYFNKAEPENLRVPRENISSSFIPLYLTDAEKDDLVQFLETGLLDDGVERFAPDHVLSGNCFPNNDPISRKELGCD